jgi:hypothetical protein
LVFIEGIKVELIGESEGLAPADFADSAEDFAAEYTDLPGLFISNWKKLKIISTILCYEY